MSSRKVSPTQPTIGALLRLANQSAQLKLAHWLGTSTHPGMQPAHCAVVQALWGRPEGVRLTDMAKAARITKQSMSALVEQLIATGHVERVADPEDGRASRLKLTKTGQAFGTAVRGFGKGLESEWAAKIGAPRMRELCEILRLIIEDEA